MELESKNKRVSYFFDEELGLYTFNKGHPMRPFRMKITDELINVGFEFHHYGGCFGCLLRVLATTLILAESAKCHRIRRQNLLKNDSFLIF